MRQVGFEFEGSLISSQIDNNTRLVIFKTLTYKSLRTKLIIRKGKKEEKPSFKKEYTPKKSLELAFIMVTCHS